jgi:hypothetical protein
MLEKVIEWLLKSSPWVEYRTRLDLLNQPPGDPAVLKARQAMISHPQVQSLLTELSDWPGTVLSSHKSAGQSFHKLAFIADLGLKPGDPYIEEIITKITAHQSEEGPFQLPMVISENYGGTGREQWAWALCDAPVILYSLVKFGMGNDQRVKKGVRYLVELTRDNGWPCAVSKELGKFRGPGRKDDPCPYANLVMLKLFSQLEEWKNSNEAHTGVETLLKLWEKSRELHSYMFYMGTDFRKLKAPLIWYDILHVLDVITNFSWARNDSRLHEMLAIVKQKMDKEGRYTPESIWKAWEDWDFGQKKQPSPGLTFLVKRIFKCIPLPNG